MGCLIIITHFSVRLQSLFTRDSYSRNFSKILFKLLISICMMEKEFLRSFWDEENSFTLKYGESTASDLLLKKLMSGSLLSSIKTFIKSKGLKICFLKCPSVEISKFYNGFMFPQVYSSSRMIANRNKYHCFLKFPLTTILSYTKIAYLPWLFNDFTDFHFTSIVSSEKLWLT